MPPDSHSPVRPQDRSRGVSSTAFHAQPPDLRFAPLMDTDFAVSCPLVRHWRLISGFCSSTRMFALRFFQTQPRGDSLCVFTSPSPPSGWAGDLHPQAAEHAQHTTKPLARRTLRVGGIESSNGGTPASKLLSDYRSGVPEVCTAFRRAFAHTARSARFGTHSLLSSFIVAVEKAFR